VDNTLLDNDRVNRDLKAIFSAKSAPNARQHYWAIFEQLRTELGYATTLARSNATASNIPATRACSSSPTSSSIILRQSPLSELLDALEHVKQWGPVVILSDGDVVFQPRKVERSGLLESRGRHALIYVHKEKELDDVEKRYPADHYVMVDDKLRILTAMKNLWRDRLTTVFPRQGHYALDAKALPLSAGDITVERIGELVNYDLPELLRTINSRKFDCAD